MYAVIQQMIADGERIPGSPPGKRTETCTIEVVLALRPRDHASGKLSKSRISQRLDLPMYVRSSMNESGERRQPQPDCSGCKEENVLAAPFPTGSNKISRVCSSRAHVTVCHPTQKFPHTTPTYATPSQAFETKQNMHKGLVRDRSHRPEMTA